MPFDSRDVRAALQSGAGPRKDELVALSVFHYDAQVRNRSGVRYLKLGHAVTDDFDQRFLGGDLDQPGLPDYAAACEDKQDVAALAEVCGRTLWAMSKNCPVDAMREQSVKSFGTRRTKECDGLYGETRAAWTRAYKSTFRQAMGETYMTLNEKSPELAQEFVSKLDMQSYRCMCQGLQTVNLSQAQKDAISSAFNPNAPTHAELNASDTRNQYYAPDAKAVVDQSLNGLLCRASWDKDSKGVYDEYDVRMRTFYTNVARKEANQYFSELTGDSREYLSYGGSRDYSLETVFAGCSDNPRKLERQVDMLAEMCSQSYYESARLAEIVSDRQKSSDVIDVIIADKPAESKSELKQSIKDTLRERTESQVQYTVSAHMDTIYSGLSSVTPDLAKQFVNGLSDDAYKGLCAQRPTVEADCPRSPEVEREPFVPRRDDAGKLNPEWFASKGLNMAESAAKLAERNSRYGHGVGVSRYVGDMSVSGASEGQEQSVSL